MKTKLLEITYIYNVKCHTFLVEVSINMFMMLQQEPIFIPVKELSSTKLDKVIKNNLLIIRC
jgi:hypothetical protein